MKKQIIVSFFLVSILFLAFFILFFNDTAEPKEKQKEHNETTLHIDPLSKGNF